MECPLKAADVLVSIMMKALDTTHDDGRDSLMDIFCSTGILSRGVRIDSHSQ